MFLFKVFGGASGAGTATRAIAKDRLSVILASQRGSELLEGVDLEALQRDVLKVVQVRIYHVVFFPLSSTSIFFFLSFPFLFFCGVCLAFFPVVVFSKVFTYVVKRFLTAACLSLQLVTKCTPSITITTTTTTTTKTSKK